jgi:hypothetical protein
MNERSRPQLAADTAQLFVRLAIGIGYLVPSLDRLGLLGKPGGKAKVAAIASGVLALLYALSMTISFGISAPLSYSVFAVSAGSFLLATVKSYRWSFDNGLA